MTDWPGLMPAAPDALERDGRLPAETRRQRGALVRYGRRGSLAVDLRAGVWTDHEAGVGGGVIALVERRTGRDRAGALDWLRDHRIGDIRSRGPERTQKRRRAPRWPRSTCRSPCGPSCAPERA